VSGSNDHICPDDEGIYAKIALPQVMKMRVLRGPRAPPRIDLAKIATLSGDMGVELDSIVGETEGNIIEETNPLWDLPFPRGISTNSF